jgi:hypothetical protein
MSHCFMASRLWAWLISVRSGVLIGLAAEIQYCCTYSCAHTDRQCVPGRGAEMSSACA